MSVATTSKPETDQCERCGDTFELRQSVAGSYCSPPCYLREKGKKALAQIKSDHRFCATCFRQIKTVEVPPETWVDDSTSMVQAALDAGATVTQFDGQLALDATDASTRRRTAGESVIGYQYPTESAQLVDDLQPLDRNGAIQKPQKKSRSVYGCECGAIDLRERDEILQSAAGGTVLVSLAKCLAHLYDQGAISQPVSVERLFDGIRETHDMEYAIGYAMYGGEA